MRVLATAFLYITAFFLGLTVTSVKAQAYEIRTDSNGIKVLKGLLKRADIEKDTSFKWFQQNYSLGQANVAAIEAFKKNAEKFQLVVFAGTWCEDTHNLLPAFYRLIDKSGYDAQNITLIGVDHEKTTLDNLHNVFHIVDVPTFIVMRDGREVGRVVEYGKSGEIDKELGDIVNSIQ